MKNNEYQVDFEVEDTPTGNLPIGELINDRINRFMLKNDYVNKTDLINNKNILPFISELKKIEYIKNFFLISARYNKGLNKLIDYISSQTYKSKWNKCIY